MKNIERILTRWGEKVSVINDDVETVSNAIIQPMNRRWKTYLSGERIPSGMLNNNHYYMIASPELVLSEFGGYVVAQDGREYTIRSCGDFKVKDNRLYVWAVLAARTARAEDDYD